MSYYFRGTTEDMISGMFVDLDKAALGGPLAPDYVLRALSGLVGLYDREAEAGSEIPPDLEQRKKAFCARLMDFTLPLKTYTALVICLGEENDPRHWYEMCIRRSVIQLLLDDASCSNVAELINPSEVAELDQLMRQMASEFEIELNELPPQGLPYSHWWWRLPDN
jgi:hypothetical protein